MMKARLIRGILFGLAALFLMPAVPASASINTDILKLKVEAQSRLVAGDLDKRQERAVEAVLRKIARIEETDPVLKTARYLSRTAKLVQTVEKAEAKGVSLGDGATPLLASLVDQVASHEGAAESARDALLIEKDWKVVDRQLVRGKAKVVAAESQTTDTRRAKKYARAAKTFLRAAARGRKLIEKEIAKGIIVFEVVGTSLDVDPVLEPGEAITIEFSLALARDSLVPQFVRISERRPDDPEGPGAAFEGPLQLNEDEPTIVDLMLDVPLEPGTWYLVVSGLDSEFQDGVRSADYPLTLENTLIVEFTVN